VATTCFTQDLHHFTLHLKKKAPLNDSFEQNLFKTHFMKKNLLFMLLAIVAIAFTAFGIINTKNETEQFSGCYSADNPLPEMPGPFTYRTEPEFVFRIGNRFSTTITPKQVKAANTILDLLPAKATENLLQHKLVKLDSLPNNNNTAIISDSEKLNPRQKSLLNAMSVSTNFYFESFCKINNTESGELNDYELVYYISVVPETPAKYNEGLTTLNNYFRQNTLDLMPLVNWERLWPGKVAFTVTKKGKIARVVTESACAQKDIDIKLIELVKNMPGHWTPAKNEKGEPVKQEFILFYGAEGC